MEALLYEVLDKQKVRCNICNHHCVINNGSTGICKMRLNKNGKLMVLNYGKSVAINIDPIEKKPIHDFLPKTYTYSFAAKGCNFKCPWCQNFQISQDDSIESTRNYPISPKKHVENAIKYHCPSISYTYSEPTVFFEYAYDTMKLASENNIRNIWVSNGYMSKEALEMILPFLDAANIDYKGNDEIYREFCGGRNQIVLENMKTMKENGVHLEVTTLLIPDLNTEISAIEEIVKDLVKYLGKDFVWHITRFFPHYKFYNKSITDKDILYKAKEIGLKHGIEKIYLGNI